MKQTLVEEHTTNLPRLGFSFPANTFSAVDFPIPFVPTSPKTCPGLGTGNLLQHSHVSGFEIKQKTKQFLSTSFNKWWPYSQSSTELYITEWKPTDIAMPSAYRPCVRKYQPPHTETCKEK
jgi:hypothetical protein